MKLLLWYFQSFLVTERCRVGSLYVVCDLSYLPSPRLHRSSPLSSQQSSSSLIFVAIRFIKIYLNRSWATLSKPSNHAQRSPWSAILAPDASYPQWDNCRLLMIWSLICDVCSCCAQAQKRYHFPTSLSLVCGSPAETEDRFPRNSFYGVSRCLQ